MRYEKVKDRNEDNTKTTPDLSLVKNENFDQEASVLQNSTSVPKFSSSLSSRGQSRPDFSNISIEKNANFTLETPDVEVKEECVSSSQSLAFSHKDMLDSVDVENWSDDDFEEDSVMNYQPLGRKGNGTSEKENIYSNEDYNKKRDQQMSSTISNIASFQNDKSHDKYALKEQNMKKCSPRRLSLSLKSKKTTDSQIQEGRLILQKKRHNILTKLQFPETSLSTLDKSSVLRPEPGVYFRCLYSYLSTVFLIHYLVWI